MNHCNYYDEQYCQTCCWKIQHDLLNQARIKRLEETIIRWEKISRSISQTCACQFKDDDDKIGAACAVHREWCDDEKKPLQNKIKELEEESAEQKTVIKGLKAKNFAWIERCKNFRAKDAREYEVEKEELEKECQELKDEMKAQWEELIVKKIADDPKFVSFQSNYGRHWDEAVKYIITRWEVEKAKNKELKELTVNEEFIKCPFCNEDDFDFVGLKNHLEYVCEIYKNTISLYEERRLKESTCKRLAKEEKDA